MALDALSLNALSFNALSFNALRGVVRVPPVFLLLVSPLLSGCFGPQLVETFDSASDSTVFQLGPLDVEGDLLGEIWMTGSIPQFASAVAAEVVNVEFRRESFKRVTFLADGHEVVVRRSLFREYGLAIPAEDFRKIAAARRVAYIFDRDDIDLAPSRDHFEFTDEQMEWIRRLARALRLLEPEAKATEATKAVEAPPLERPAIHELQGAHHRSPYTGRQVVDVRGVVTCVERRGFHLQTLGEHDSDPRTSEAILVFTRSRPEAKIGDHVSVDGRVAEFVPGGRETGNLSTTEIVQPVVRILERAQKLPAGLLLGAGGRRLPTRIVDNDAAAGRADAPQTPFDPEEDGIDFFESLESQRVRLQNAVVVGPTDRHGQFWVLVDGGEGAGPRTSRGGLLLRPDDRNPERIRVRPTDELRLAVGDRLAELEGVLGYDHGNFVLLVDGKPGHEAGGLEPETCRFAGDAETLTVATYNVWNLSKVHGDRLTRIGEQIVRALRAPDLLALQEVQDNNGPQDDGVVRADRTHEAILEAIRRAGGPRYVYRQIDPGDRADGGQPGGNIRVSILLREDRARFVDRVATDGAPGSPSRIGAGELLFHESRKPLVCEVESRGKSLLIVNLHLPSKYGSPPSYGWRQPPGDAGERRRLDQALHIRRQVEAWKRARPGLSIVVLGDLNDFEFRPAIRALEGDSGLLSNLLRTLPLAERYTYNFEGNAQVLDHILVDESLREGAELDVVHINSEFPSSASDHDPVVARLRWNTSTTGSH